MQAYEDRPLPLPYTVSESGLRVELSLLVAKKKITLLYQSRELKGIVFYHKKGKRVVQHFCIFVLLTFLHLGN